MKLKKTIFVLIILYTSTLIAFSNNTVGFSGNLINEYYQSCTIFTAKVGEKILFSNNEDMLMEGTYIWLVPNQVINTSTGPMDIYGTIFFGFDNNNFIGDGYPQGGMNEKGLCWDGNGLPLSSLNPHPELNETHPDIHLWYEILWTCDTVEDVINYFQTHYLGNLIGCQIHFADRLGNAAVVSGGPDRELAYTRINGSNFLISTNFNLAKPSNGWYPCWRYSTAFEMLSKITNEYDLTVKACREVLDAVHVDYTSYSNIFDLNRRVIYIYQNHNFNEVARLNLNYELKKVSVGRPNVRYCNFSGGILKSCSIENQDKILVKEIKISDLFDIQRLEQGLSIICIRLIEGATLIGLSVIINRRRRK
jgi:choloylglycine hydrolase